MRLNEGVEGCCGIVRKLSYGIALLFERNERRYEDHLNLCASHSFSHTFVRLSTKFFFPFLFFSFFSFALRFSLSLFQLKHTFSIIRMESSSSSSPKPTTRHHPSSTPSARIHSSSTTRPIASHIIKSAHILPFDRHFQLPSTEHCII